MITNILYRCPECGCFEWFEQNRCRHCRVSVHVLSREKVAVNGESGSISRWYARVKTHALPKGSDGVILTSGPIRLSREKLGGEFTGLSGVHAVLHGRATFDQGTVSLYHDRLLFQGASQNHTIPFESISAVTIESNTVIVDRIGGRTLYFDFLEESGKKWEDCIQKSIAEFYHPEVIAEFCPKLRFARTRRRLRTGYARFHNRHEKASRGNDKEAIPWMTQCLRILVGYLAQVRFQ